MRFQTNGQVICTANDGEPTSGKVARSGVQKGSVPHNATYVLRNARAPDGRPPRASYHSSCRSESSSWREHSSISVEGIAVTRTINFSDRRVASRKIPVTGDSGAGKRLVETLKASENVAETMDGELVLATKQMLQATIDHFTKINGDANTITFSARCAKCKMGSRMKNVRRTSRRRRVSRLLRPGNLEICGE